MFSKKIENNIIDYIIVSPIEEIFINVLVDDNHFIVQTNITYVMLEDNFSCFGKPVKVGDTDYIMADGETKW